MCLTGAGGVMRRVGGGGGGEAEGRGGRRGTVWESVSTGAHRPRAGGHGLTSGRRRPQVDELAVDSSGAHMNGGRARAYRARGSPAHMRI